MHRLELDETRFKKNRNARKNVESQPDSHEDLYPAIHIEIAFDPVASVLREHRSIEVRPEIISIIDSLPELEPVPVELRQHGLRASVPGKRESPLGHVRRFTQPPQTLLRAQFRSQHDCVRLCH